MRVAFMGTPRLAATILETLAAAHEVVCVYTRADAVRSRGSRAEPSAVRRVAESLGIEVRTPKTLRDADEQRALRDLAPDVVCVVAYGMILPPEVLAIPRFGCVNVHASLLPRWRGAAPIERAILAGDEETGVCIMRMEEGLDTGPYCLRKTIPIGEKSSDELTCELARLGAEALVEALALIERGEACWVAQPEEGASYAHRVEKSELALDPDEPSETAARKVRASSASRPARCLIAGKPVALLQAHVAEPDELGDAASAPPSGRAALVSKRLVLGTADGVIVVSSVKPDGKKAMDGAAFAAGIQGIKRDGASWERVDG